LFQQENAAPTRRDLVREKSVTMEYFLETSYLDAATADMLKKYNTNGDGSFSKAEVVAIVLDLQETMRANETLVSSNKLFKRLVIASFIFCALLLISMFGLSYAVAAITANTEVRSDGTMLTKGGASVIATDSAASKFDFGRNENGQYCILPEEMHNITEQVFSGRNVLVELGEFTENHKVVEQLRAAGADINEASGVVCFGKGGDENRSICFLPTEEDCVAVDSHGRRKLTEDRQLIKYQFDAYMACPCGLEVVDEIEQCIPPIDTGQDKGSCPSS
jgi:hypothetical protein